MGIGMKERPSLKDILRGNRRTIMAILMIPVVGMVVAISLICVRSPENILLSVGLIIPVLIQYLILVYYISRRIDRLTSA